MIRIKVGVAVLARALASAGVIPEPVGWVIVIGAIVTMIFSFFMYLSQKDMKRLLAFSTISQLSYIILGFGFFVFSMLLNDRDRPGDRQGRGRRCHKHAFYHPLTPNFFSAQRAQKPLW